MNISPKPDIPVDLPVTKDDDLKVEYRQLDAAEIEQEISKRARNVGRALRGYESAKAVSQETLDTPICV